MLKTLFKKQFMEINTWLIVNKKNGKNRNLREIIGMVVLYAYVFIVFGRLFFMVADSLVAPLHGLGFDWLYFTMTTLTAIMIGVFGSIFNTSATLYKAKDNDLLLSMPIPPTNILTVRLFGVWFWSFIYELIVFVPTIIAYFKATNFSMSILLCYISLMLLTSLFVLILSCVLGWGVAKISSKLKSKNIVTVVLSLAFLAVYYYFYFKANELLQHFLLNIAEIGETVKGSAYPLYIVGKAATGDLLSLLIVGISVVALFSLVYFVLAKSFIKMATLSETATKKIYKEKKLKAKNLHIALFFKELKRFSSSSVYMLNCGLGIIFMLGFGVFVLIKPEFINDMLSQLNGELKEFVPLVMCAGLCMIASFNDISAPSVSLEGKNIWIVQSLPIPAWSIFKAKLALHFVLTEIPLLFLIICVISATSFGITEIIFMFLLPSLFVLLVDAIGLAINLKFPDLKWTHEVVPVKQNIGVFFSLFSGFTIIAVLSGLYYFLYDFVTPILFLELCTVILIVAISLILLWLNKRGTKIFAGL